MSGYFISHSGRGKNNAKKRRKGGLQKKGAQLLPRPALDTLWLPAASPPPPIPSWEKNVVVATDCPQIFYGSFSRQCPKKNTSDLPVPVGKWGKKRKKSQNTSTVETIKMHGRNRVKMV